MLRLLGATADLQVTTKAGATLLHGAAEGGSSVVCDLLIAAGLDVNAGHVETGVDEIDRGARRATPLIVAARHGHADFCELPLKASANVESRDQDGNTPFIAAAKKRARGSLRSAAEIRKSSRTFIRKLAPIGHTGSERKYCPDSRCTEATGRVSGRVGCEIVGCSNHIDATSGIAANTVLVRFRFSATCHHSSSETFSRNKRRWT